MEGEMVLVKSSRKTMVSLSRLPVRQECERFEGIVALDGGWAHVSIVVVRLPNGDRRFGWFGP